MKREEHQNSRKTISGECIVCIKILFFLTSHDNDALLHLLAVDTKQTNIKICVTILQEYLNSKPIEKITPPRVECYIV